MLSTDGNGCWGGCNDSVKLYPNQATYFVAFFGKRNPFDSMQYDIVVKIKRGLKIKDSTVTKKLILDKDHFIEDLSNWTKVVGPRKKKVTSSSHKI